RRARAVVHGPALDHRLVRHVAPPAKCAHCVVWVGASVGQVSTGAPAAVVVPAPIGGVGMNGSGALPSMPRETQLRLSAHTSSGGSTTSELSSAMATFRAPMRPKP